MNMILDNLSESYYLSEDFFEIYLRATSLWPQRRGGVNLYLIAQLFSSRFDLQAWNVFMLSVLSPTQIERAYDVMRRLHYQSGIDKQVNRDRIADDWGSVKSSVHRSVIYRLSGVDPIPSLSNKDLMDQTKICSTGNMILNNLNDSIVKHIEKMAFSGMNLLDKNKKLSIIYRFSFFTKEQQLRDLNIKRDIYFESISTYFPELSLNNYFQLTPSIFFDKIRDMLSKEFDHMFPSAPKDWLLWGFLPLK